MSSNNGHVIITGGGTGLGKATAILFFKWVFDISQQFHEVWNIQKKRNNYVLQLLNTRCR
ncbi:MAG: hypothetical protein EZS28_042713, partial [Streblomastix strix]